MNIQYLNPKKILTKQFDADVFTRIDIIIRYLVVEQYFGKNNCGFILYKKMYDGIHKEYSGREKPPHNLRKFKKLINNINTMGFINEYPVVLNKKNIIIDGAHRTACALYFNIKNMPVHINEEYSIEFVSRFSLQWFINNGFTNKEIAIIKNKTKELLYFDL